MTDSSNILAWDKRHIWHPFTQAATAVEPLVVDSAEGAILKTADGKDYIDFIASWWVTTHGHAHPKIAKAIAAQASRLEQVIFADITHAPAARLAAKLAERLPGDLERVFFSDDGSTAVEVALKAALQFHSNRNDTKRTRFLAFEGGYHGDTVGAMSVGKASGFFDEYQRLLFPIDAVPFAATWEGDDEVETKEQVALVTLDRLLDEAGAETAAIILEPLIQGAGGMRMCRPSFIKAVCERVRKAGGLIIFDEVMTGFGRTGTLFACELCDIMPDFICLSKGLTGGFMPLSVTVARNEIYEAFLGEEFSRGLTHGHSFTANPLGCAAALASFEVFEEENTLDRISAIHEAHRAALQDLQALDKVEHVRLTGTILALDVKAGKAGYESEAGPKLKKFFLSRGLLIRPLGNVVYLMPPYCVSDDQLARAYDGIASAVSGL